MTRIATIAALMSSLAFLVAGVFVWEATPDPADHHRYTSALTRAEDLDVRLDAELARSRLGLVTHYDGLVRLDDETVANLSVLRQPPRRVDVAAELALYESTVHAKRQVAEIFKTQQAILRNSLRLLPFTSDRLVRDETLNSPLHHATLAAVAKVLAGSVDPSPDRWAAARCGLVPLGGPPLVGCASLPIDIPPPERGGGGGPRGSRHRRDRAAAHRRSNPPRAWRHRSRKGREGPSDAVPAGL